MKNALSILLLLAFLSAPLTAAKIPDYTAGDKPDAKARERVMGPTGLWGICHSEKMHSGGSRDARQFLITKVDAGSPADGKIKPGDVITGVDAKPFAMDCRRALAAAINRAEAETGTLSLLVWRAGKTSSVALKLHVLGAYDPTSPYDCPQNTALVERLGDFTLTVKLPPEKRSKDQLNITFPWLYSLGMLSTGRDDLMPQIKAFAHDMCVDSKTGGPITFEVSSQGKRVWRTAYRVMFLAEYYIATGDETVLPTLTEYAVGAAKGQSGAGTYGHRFSSRTDSGDFHGPLEGYGAINNAGLSMVTALLLAKKAGVEHPEIDRAITMGKRFFDFYVEHGVIPYGDHWTHYSWFDDNGKSGLASVMYELMGDSRGQRFFTGMTVASSPTGREEGHQGCYWSHLWGGLGALRSGEEGLNAFTAEMRFIRTLERRWNGQVYDNGNIAHKYGSRGDVTGERLLLYTLHDKRLILNGKNLTVREPLKGKALTDGLEGGRISINPDARKALSEDRIFELLEHELTPVRMAAAKALQEQGLKKVDRLITMLDSKNKYARYGACNGLSMAGYNSEEAVSVLIDKIASATDPNFRYFAIDALSSGKGKDYGLHAAGSAAVPLLLKLAGEPVPDGERGQLHWLIAETLYYYRKDLITAYPQDQLDDQALVTAISQILKNENGRARSAIPFKKLTKEQVEALYPSILAAVRERAPSGIMFSNGVRTKGLTLLARHRIKEGLDYMKELAIEERDNSTMWVPWHAKTLFAELPNYGQDAADVVAIIEQWPVLEKRGASLAKELPALKKKIASSEKVKLKSIAN